ncbi:MAG TPA: hypothetical protein VGM21_16980 [Actinomycetota bacterium]
MPATRPASVPARRHDHGRHEGGHARTAGSSEAMEATARTAAAADAQLLGAIKTIARALAGSVPSLYPRVIFLALGYASIGPLAAAYSEVLPLPYGARLILLPAVLLSILVGFRHKQWGRRALVGWLAGVAATGIYDVLRLSLYKFGYWDDPIPGIGRLMLDDPNASAIWGYVWRFGGNGAGMGMAFAMLPWRGIRSGIVYGTSICFGLFAVLALAPVAQQHFFPLNLKTAVGALAGHWVYGAVLGYLTSVSLPPVRLAGPLPVLDPATVGRGALAGWRPAVGGLPGPAVLGVPAPAPPPREPVAGTARRRARTDPAWSSTGGQAGWADQRPPRPGPPPGQAPGRAVPGAARQPAQPESGRAPGGRHVRQPDSSRRAGGRPSR